LFVGVTKQRRTLFAARRRWKSTIARSRCPKSRNNNCRWSGWLYIRQAFAVVVAEIRDSLKRAVAATLLAGVLTGILEMLMRDVGPNLAYHGIAVMKMVIHGRCAGPGGIARRKEGLVFARQRRRAADQAGVRVEAQSGGKRRRVTEWRVRSRDVETKGLANNPNAVKALVTVAAPLVTPLV